MPKRLKKLSEEVIHSNPWWTYKHDRYVLPNGTEGDYYYADLNGVTMIIPVLEDGRIVLTLQHRYLVDKQSIEFPAGAIKDEQEPAEAAREELKEETGCEVKELIKLAKFEPANGYAKDTTHVFLAHVESIGEQELDVTEDIEVLFRRPEEIDTMIRQGDIWDGQSIASWFFAKQYLSL